MRTSIKLAYRNRIIKYELKYSNIIDLIIRTLGSIDLMVRIFTILSYRYNKRAYFFGLNKIIFHENH